MCLYTYFMLVYIHTLFRRKCYSYCVWCVLLKHFLLRIFPGHSWYLLGSFFERGAVKVGDEGWQQQLVNALAPCFIQSGEVVIKEGADISNLSSDDVVKEGTF